jgi:MraZ protein
VGNSSQQVFMIIGQYTHEIDSKKRLTLPAKWRKSLGDRVVMTSGLDTSLFVFSVSEWNVIAEKLASSSLGNSEARNFNRFFLSNAFEIDIDAQGRIVIPENLKQFAKLGDKVVLAGMYKRIEVWDEVLWNMCMEKSKQNANSVAEALSSLGVL